MKIDVSNIGL